MMTQSEQAKAAKKFSQDWKGKGYEKGESQKFWLDLLCNVFGVQDFADFITFEDQVKLDHTSFIDGYISATRVLIEQKSLDKNLREPIKQSDGSFLTPFQQAKRYITELPVSKHPRWVVTCNFKSFLVYDMENPNGEPEEILLENLEKEFYRLSFITATESVHMAWMRAVAGRLKSDYRYSKDIVYNNFPWPLQMENGKLIIEDELSEKQKLSILNSQLSIQKTAQAILDARAKFPDSSLADLYDEAVMPPELRKAHQENDKAVMKAYGFSLKMTESECVSELFKMYEKLTQKIQNVV